MIDLKEYTPKKRRFLKVIDRICVYIVGPKEGRPIKIGIASDIYTRFSSIQTGNWNALYVHDLIWLPGPPVGQRIESVAHDRLKEKQISGEWFETTHTEASALIRNLMAELYPTIRWDSHDATLEKLRGKLLDRKDWETHSVDS